MKEFHISCILYCIDIASGKTKFSMASCDFIIPNRLACKLDILMELSFQLPVIRKESAVEPLVTQTWGMAAGVTLNSMGVLFSYYYSMRDLDAGMIPLACPWIQHLALLVFFLRHVSTSGLSQGRGLRRISKL